jgi:hypothetical protein
MLNLTISAEAERRRPRDPQRTRIRRRPRLDDKNGARKAYVGQAARPPHLGPPEERRMISVVSNFTTSGGSLGRSRRFNISCIARRPIW